MTSEPGTEQDPQNVTEAGQGLNWSTEGARQNKGWEGPTLGSRMQEGRLPAPLLSPCP